MTGRPGETLHASCVILGEAGILIRGESGSGKSTVAQRLIERWSAQGHFAAWVADDRVRVTRTGDRLIARPVAAIAGRLEVRGLGIMAVAHEPATVLRLVVDLCSGPAKRLPSRAELVSNLAGVELPRIAAQLGSAIDLTSWRICDPDDTFVTGK